MFRAVVVSPPRLTAATRRALYEARKGPIVRIAGSGYHGQAQSDPAAAQAASGLEQSTAQIVSGEVIVRLLVTYHRGASRSRTSVGERACCVEHRSRQPSGA